MDTYKDTIVFVADYFEGTVSGGAELTMSRIMDSCPKKYVRFKSNSITNSIVEMYKDSYWIFGNYSKFNLDFFLKRKIKYSVIEFDYKFCLLRLLEHHKDGPCTCDKTKHGQNVFKFLANAERVFFMSEKQMSIHLDRCNLKSTTVLSACFKTNDLDLLKEQRQNNIRKDYGVLISEYWQKGTDNAIQYCNENKFKIQKLHKLRHQDLIKTLGRLEGLVFLPNGADTCPMLVTEAKLAGCKLHINDFVQHKDESWFNTDDLESIDQHLRTAPNKLLWDKLNIISH